VVEFLNFSFDYPEDNAQQRRSYRVHYPGLTVRVPTFDTAYPVLDLSTFGVAFRDESQSFRQGQEIELDLYVQGKIWIAGLMATVVRVRESVLVACNFEALTKQQEVRMDKLTLEIQKRWIAYRKRQQQQEMNTDESKKT
jgi:hypothetical protein